MEKWFFTVEILGVVFKKRDVSEVTNISGVPVILFKEHGETVQSVYGAMGKADFLGKVRSIWPEI
jgi:thioredoxin-related protein